MPTRPSPALPPHGPGAAHDRSPTPALALGPDFDAAVVGPAEPGWAMGVAPEAEPEPELRLGVAPLPGGGITPAPFSVGFMSGPLPTGQRSLTEVQPDAVRAAPNLARRPAPEATPAPRAAAPTAAPEATPAPRRAAPTAVPEATPAPRAAEDDARLIGLRGEDEAPDLKPGMLLGDYRLESLLGEGGSASVWRATDVRLHMPIALKLFNPRGRGGRALLRGVMREARAASRVVSDHVLRVKDAGYWEELGLGFIAMELCAAYPDVEDLQAGTPNQLQVGRTLEQAPPTTLRECLRVMAEAARGVADAHREGVFHRDVKPANILLRPGSLRAQITDFGLTVAELRSRRSGSVRIAVDKAQKRFIQGTPEYMAPEAARGLPLGLDPTEDRALLTGLDVYGLGATLYALLAGDLPFAAREGARNPIADVLHQVQAGPPPDLMDRERNRVDVPEHVARVVRRAMARDPQERHPSALALAEDLEALIQDRPTSLDEPFPGHRLGLFLRRNRLQVSAAASVAVLLCTLTATALVGSWLDARIEDAEQQIAELAAKRDEAQALATHWEQEASDSTRMARAAASEAAQARQVIAKTETNLDKANNRIQRLTATLDLTRADLLAMTEQSQGHALERDAALAEAASWRGRAEQGEARLSATSAELARTTSRLDAQTERAERAEDARDTALAEASAWRQRSERAEAEAGSARVELAEAQRAASALTARASGAEQRATRAEAEVAELTRKLAAAQAIGEAARAEAAVLRQRLAAIEQGTEGP